MSTRSTSEETTRKTAVSVALGTYDAPAAKPPSPATEKHDLGEIDWTECPAIERDPDRLSGAWCFEGTRLPVHALFMNLSSGLTIPEFLETFPAANLKHIKSVLDFLSDRLEETTTE